eukprot:1155989-Pelagomonas_calceolata.AAC.3
MHPGNPDDGFAWEMKCHPQPLQSLPLGRLPINPSTQPTTAHALHLALSNAVPTLPPPASLPSPSYPIYHAFPADVPRQTSTAS